jgi:DNA mismatch repair protein MutL
VFSTLGNGDRLAAIASVFGSKTAEHLVPISAERGEMRLHGYVSGTLGLRRDKRGQHVFVNGRPVVNAVVERAIAVAYREFAEPGRFPVVFLFLEVSPSKVDVNIHPAKSDISFENRGEIADFVTNSIREVLVSERAIPQLRPSGLRNDTTFHLQQEATGEASDRNKHESTLVSTSGGTGEKIEEVDINILLSGMPPAQPPSSGLLFSENTYPDYEATLIINELTAIATLFAAYILATDGDTFYIIDQHAAHERVNYERFSKAWAHGGIAMQQLLTPYIFTPPASVDSLESYIRFYERLGFEIEEFGENTWIARTYPAFISQEEAETFFLESLESLGLSEPPASTSSQEVITDAAAERIMMRACKASVKANQVLSETECAALIEALSKCENPFTCPHGRPVFLKLKRQDIERLFKRS